MKQDHTVQCVVTSRVIHTLLSTVHNSHLRDLATVMHHQVRGPRGGGFEVIRALRNIFVPHQIGLCPENFVLNI